MDNLTDKQRRFCEEYVVDWNATQAAIRAGYAKKGARTEGARLLANANIKQYIDDCRQKTAELAGISALRVAREYERLAFANMSDLKIDWAEVKDWNDLTDVQKAAISEIETITRTIGSDDDAVIVDTKVKVKMHDKQKALEALRKMFGMDQASAEIEDGDRKIKVTLKL